MTYTKSSIVSAKNYSESNILTRLDRRVLAFYEVAKYFHSMDANLFSTVLKMLDIDNDTMENVVEKLLRLGLITPLCEPTIKH
jgi:Holliday junction resolvasome RuvABC ATP-dependent DNA helicase subunit